VIEKKNLLKMGSHHPKEKTILRRQAQIAEVLSVNLG